MTVPSDKWPLHLQRRWRQSQAIHERLQQKDRETAAILARERDIARGRLEPLGEGGGGRINPLIFEDEE